MIGKGARNQAVKEAVVRSGAVYLAALGGAGALMAASVEELEVICWEDLGCEAVRRLTVRDLPLTVILDAHGGDLYESGRRPICPACDALPDLFTSVKEEDPMFTCASCTIEACRSGQLDKMPKNCPMRDRAFFDSILEEYFKTENHEFFHRQRRHGGHRLLPLAPPAGGSGVFQAHGLYPAGAGLLRRPAPGGRGGGPGPAPKRLPGGLRHL